jgi:hypothetical protein
MSEEKKQMTAADLRLDAGAKAAIVNALAEKMRLRQWCVEQAVESLKAIGTNSPPSYLEEIIKILYTFLTSTKETSDE